MKKDTFLSFFIIILLSLHSMCLMSQDRKKVLWLGTSIPGGCTYPKVACEQNDMGCINKAVGSSFLCKWLGHETKGLHIVKSMQDVRKLIVK